MPVFVTIARKVCDASTLSITWTYGLDGVALRAALLEELGTVLNRHLRAKSVGIKATEALALFFFKHLHHHLHLYSQPAAPLYHLDGEHRPHGRSAENESCVNEARGRFSSTKPNSHKFAKQPLIRIFHFFGRVTLASHG